MLSSLFSVILLSTQVQTIVSPFKCWTSTKTLLLVNYYLYLFLNLLPQCVSLPLVLNITLFCILLVILPNPYILINIDIRISLFHWMFLQHTHCYIIYQIWKITYIQIHTINICAPLLNNRTTINNEQWTLNFWGEVRNTAFYPFANFLFRKYRREQTINHLFQLTIFGFDSKTILPHHILITPNYIIYLPIFLPYLVLLSICPYLTATTNPKFISILSWFSSLISFVNKWTCYYPWGGKRLSISVAIHYCTVEGFFCVLF